MTALKGRLTDVATSFVNTANGVAKDLRSCTRDVWDTVQYRTNRAVRKSSAYVHKNPLPTALTAFGGGLVLGMLLQRRDTLSLTEPRRRSAGVPLGTIIAGITLLRSILSDAPRTAKVSAPMRGTRSRKTSNDDIARD